MEVYLAALLSGLAGVAISTGYHRRNEVRRTKMEVLRELLGNRYFVTGERFTVALNQVFLFFMTLNR